MLRPVCEDLAGDPARSWAEMGTVSGNSDGHDADPKGTIYDRRTFDGRALDAVRSLG